MTTFWALIGLTLLVAVVDWWAVVTDRRGAEYVLKPLTMVVLIAAALALPDPVTDGARLFIVVGLVCSLAGDVFLMLDERLFIGGLVSFLIGHVMYIIGLLRFDEITPPLLFVGVLVVLVAAAVIGSRVVRGAGEADPRLTGPVSAAPP